MTTPRRERIRFWACAAIAALAHFHFDIRAAELEKLVIITPHAESIRYEFAAGFSEWHARHFGKPVQLDWRDLGGTSDALKFVQSEFSSKPDGIGIDCFFGGGPEPYLLLADKKLVEPYDLAPETRVGLVQNFSGIEVFDSKHSWYGAALSSFGILQNTAVQRRMNFPVARRWEDLADPRLLGWVAAGDPRNSGTMNNMYEAFFQACGWEKGWDLLTRIAGNVGKFDRISSTSAKEVTLGEAACGFAIDFYGFTQIAAAGRTNMTFALPEDFTSISPDGLCVFRGAPHREIARHFLDYVMGEDGQKLWFLPVGTEGGPRRYSIERMSVRPDFYKRFKGISNIEFSPFDLQQNFRYNAKLAKTRREIVATMVGAMLVDTHMELVPAWRAVVRRGLKAEDIAELGRPPISEKEALELAATGFREAAVRNARKIEWQEWARKKYLRLARGNSV